MRRFKEYMSRVFSGTFGSLRSFGIKRTGSDIIYSCIPRVNSSWPHCGLCKKRITLEHEIFMFGDTPFCSEDCRAVAITATNKLVVR